MQHIFYKSGYKYQLTKDYLIQTTIKPKHDIETDYIALSRDGLLLVKKSYAWDGPSGPTVDTKSFMRGSAAHDALYQLMRLRLLNKRLFRKPADKLLRKICKQDGMLAPRASWVYWGVRIGGESSASQSSQKKTLQAPGLCI